MCRRQVSNAASCAGDRFQMLLHVQETGFKYSPYAGDTNFKCYFMCRRHRFQSLLHVQETGLKCSPYAGDTDSKCLLQARIFWLRHLITFLSLLRVRISTVGHNPFHSLSNNDVPTANNKLQATSLRETQSWKLKSLIKFHRSVVIFPFTRNSDTQKKKSNSLLFRRQV